MSVVKFSLVKPLVGLCLCTLWACSSTPVVQVDSSKTNQSVAQAVANPSLMQYNQQLEQELNVGDVATLQNKIDVLSIAKHLRLKHPTQFSNLLNTAKVAADIKQQLLAGIIDISQSFNWHYLHSEILQDQSVVAYYRIDSDASYSYVSLWLEPQSYKIYDFHSVSYAYSALDFVGKFSQLFSLNVAAQPQLNALVKSLQTNEILETVKIYQSLAPALQNDGALNDFILRQYSQLSANNAQILQKIILPVLEQPGHSSLLFEAHYIQLDNFAAAIKMVEGLPLFALQDSKMQSELAILYAYHNDFVSAMKHGRQAILAEPNQIEAYFVMLQVSFLAKDYALSLDLMNVLVAKFDYKMGPDVIAEFEESYSFLASAEYKSWLKQRSNS